MSDSPLCGGGFSLPFRDLTIVDIPVPPVPSPAEFSTEDPPMGASAALGANIVALQKGRA
jgi:hypothetical protein